MALIAHPVRADEALMDAFTVRNGNPYVALFGLPESWAVGVPAPGKDSFSVRYEVASSFDFGELPGESVALDGETERLTLSYERSLGERWAWGVAVPWVRHSDGYLDSLIIDWHDLFGLPQNGRDKAPKNRLAYGFANGDENIFIDDSVSGLGDVQFSLARRFGDGNTSLRVHAKLPTGDADDLLGSGGADLAVTLQHARDFGERWQAGLHGGVTLLSEGDVFEELSRPAVGHFGARVAFRPTGRLALKVQWDVHSQVFEDTRLKHLNEVAYVLSFGGSVRMGNYLLDVVVTENYPHPEITPDVAFQLALRRSVR